MKLPVLSTFLAVLLLCLTASYAIVYTGLQSFSQDQLLTNTDVSKYLALYRGEQVMGHWRWRVLIPSLARTLPDLPKACFSEDRDLSDFWMAKVKFGIVNLFFLSATGLLFFYFLTAFGFSSWESLLGVFLFYTARPVLQYTGIPMADAGAYFFLLLCFFALQRQDSIILAAAFFIGIFVKEVVYLAFPAALFLKDATRYKIKAVVLMAMAFAGYCLVRFYLWPDPQENNFNLSLMLSLRHHIACVSRVNRIADLVSSFGVLWIFVLYGLFSPEVPALLKRWSWLIVIMLFVAGFTGRILFLAFPVVIPLALGGIRRAIKYLPYNL